MKFADIIKDEKMKKNQETIRRAKAGLILVLSCFVFFASY
jgi:hypothetical protein